MPLPFRPSDKQGKLLLRTFIDLESQILRLLPDLPWIRLLVRGLLVALEDWYIEAKTINAVDKAIREYEAQEPLPADPTVYDFDNLHIYHPAFR